MIRDFDDLRLRDPACRCEYEHGNVLRPAEYAPHEQRGALS